MSKYIAALVVLAPLCAGCRSHYTVPGEAADLSVFLHGGELDPVRETDERPAADLSLGEILARKPMAAFPTALAVVRVQSSDYRSHTARAGDRVGSGAYSVLTRRDIEQDSDFERLADLPLVQGIAPFNRLLVPGRLRDDLDLRRIAAQLHADILVLYTLDTGFELDQQVDPLTVLTLGVFRSKKATVRTTASALLLDTRTGYLYATAQGNAEESVLTSTWGESAAVDRTRRTTERAAFGQLLDEVELAWRGVVEIYGFPQTRGTR